MRGAEIPELISTYQDTALPVSCEEAIQRFTDNIHEGNHWSSGLLEAVNRWTLSEEIYKGRLYRYLIQGEAFDLKLLAYRILQPARSLIPLEEYKLFLLSEEFHETILGTNIRAGLGPLKFQGYLNYWYGITVEIALQSAVFQEVRKEEKGRGRNSKGYSFSEVYSRIYGFTPIRLFDKYKKTLNCPDSFECVFGYSKQFTYWLFKLRIARCEKARVASDTKKALEWLQKYGSPLQVLL